MLLQRVVSFISKNWKIEKTFRVGKMRQVQDVKSSPGDYVKKKRQARAKSQKETSADTTGSGGDRVEVSGGGGNLPGR